MRNLPQIKANIILIEDIQTIIKSTIGKYVGCQLTEDMRLKIQNEIENLLVDKNYDKEKIFFTLDFNQ